MSVNTSGYSRCGRTDSGVSALGNVVSLWIRKMLFFLSTHRPTKPGKPDFEDYCKVINHKLPSDIKILGWSPVPYSFNARYSCLYREYMYYFIEEDLNIDKMKEAATKFLGTHNFINFCKKDPKDNQNFMYFPVIHRRSLFKAEIRLIKKSEDTKMSIYALYLRGSSFLWHQVRCMMGVLFLIGKGQQESSFVSYMLDITKCIRRPEYF